MTAAEIHWESPVLFPVREKYFAKTVSAWNLERFAKNVDSQSHPRMGKVLSTVETISTQIALRKSLNLR